MPTKKIHHKIKISLRTKKQNKVLLKFLKQTKEGKYAIVEKSSIKYSRWNQEPTQSNEEEYYYGLS